jgi:hypothetical protein
MMRSNLWTELTTKGIYGKGKDRELAVIEDVGRRGNEGRGYGIGEEKREEKKGQAQRQSAELSW